MKNIKFNLYIFYLVTVIKMKFKEYIDNLLNLRVI